METVFLLGGHDLEMLEVKKMLEQREFAVCDAGLCWDNAELNAYRDVLEQNPNARYVGIELCDPFHLASQYNYTLIDHHNELCDRPAAILQVADLLGVKADRWMRLVAANDSGYIPAMLSLGATDEEVAMIRRKDRCAQGVTEEDESLAELSVKKHLSQAGNTLIVYALTSHFSAICDRLFPYHSLLIYTEGEWVFYGEGKSTIAKRLAEHIEAKRVYHGGGDSGYIGSVKRAFSPKEIKQFVFSIIH